MITTDQEAIFLKGLKLKNLAVGGIDGEKRNAGIKLRWFLKEYDLKESDLTDFETKAAQGFRVVYLNNVFYNGDDLVNYLKTKPIKEQLRAFFSILKDLIARRFKKNTL